MAEIIYRVANESDKEKVGKFLYDHFWPDEPTFKAAGVLPNKEENDDVLKCIDYGTCTIAEDQNGTIAGVRLAKVRVPADIEKPAEKPWTQLDKILNSCSMLICVSRDFRGKGVGLKLYSENMELGKRLGFKAYVCDCTSAFSAKLCEKLGMEVIAAIEYTECLDENGEQLFKPEAIHDKIRMYGKAL
uniref:N-acetyltransferase domain-containing protein n=1 Tax=Megaselia scalaris TaxID=36166 RepID=T1GHU7_MEGSC